MQFASALSTAPTLELACREAAKGALAGLSGRHADLAVVFASPGYGDLEPLPRLIAEACAPRCLVGCTGGGIVGGGLEVESRLALTVLLAALPNVGLHTRLIDDAELPGGDE